MVDSVKEAWVQLVSALRRTTAARIQGIETVWKKGWFGYCLIAIGAGAFLWFTWQLPPSGYSITAMAVVAAVMALRPEIGGREKWLWFVLLLAFMVVEIRAINKDRKDQADNFGKIVDNLQQAVQKATEAVNELKTLTIENRTHFDQTMGAIGDSVKTQTGGDSFAFISFTAQQANSFEVRWNNFVAPRGQPYFVVSVASHGKYPLRGTHATMMDDERRLAAMQEYNKHPNGDWMQAINSADTEYQMPYLRPQSPEAPTGQVDVIGLYPMPQADSKRLTINFSAPNGYWNEVLHLGRVNGVWHQCFSVLGPTVKQAKKPFVYCDSDWPEGKSLAEKDWQFPKTKQQSKHH
jgi:hypothetical protein